MKRFKIILFILAFLMPVSLYSSERVKYNFNSDWSLHVGDDITPKTVFNTDKKWKQVTLPHAFNEDEAFKLSIDQLTDTIVWYRKSFKLPPDDKNKKVFIEFEGVRQAVDFYVNGHYVGLHENGVMAFGYDITPYLKAGKINEIALRIDNGWQYKERDTDTQFQWNNKIFNANYGGIPKNVWLHVTDKLYQTLPLYSSLQTTGVYIYVSNIHVKSRRAIVNAESEIRNEHNKRQTVGYEVALYDRNNTLVTTFKGDEITIQPGETQTVKASTEVLGLHFWSWGYGYLYTVKTRLVVNGKITDEVVTKTGFRKTRFADGKIWLNDRVIQMKGYAQRTSNEWPSVGMSVPAWLSDYSNDLLVKSGGNC